MAGAGSSEMPRANPWPWLSDKDIIAREQIAQILLGVGSGQLYAIGKTSGIRYKLVVFEDQGGPQLGIED